MLELIASQNFALLEDFERVHLLCVFLLDEEDLAVAALADHLDRAEVTHRDLPSLGLGPIAHELHLIDRFLVCRLLY